MSEDIPEQGLTLVFRRLIDTLERNNEVLVRTVTAVDGLAQKYGVSASENTAIPEGITREQQVRVEIKCTFLKIIDIDTLEQTFEAEFFVQAKWQEPALAELPEKDVEHFDEQKYWNPQLIIMNIDGQLTMNRKTYIVRLHEDGYLYPVVLQLWRFQAKFCESLELQHFPFDVQDLTLQLSTERSQEEVELIEDQHSLCTVNTESFLDSQEWALYEHVETYRDRTTVEYVSSTVHPILHIQCRVARKVGFFIWNIVFIVVLIIFLTFTGFAISPNSADRLVITITLFLTSVAFKLVVKQSLPTISYLTYLDLYVLAALIFLTLYATENSLMLLLSKYFTLTEVEHYDHWSLGTLILILISFHAIYGVYILVTAAKRRRIMKRKDKLYKTRKLHLEEYGYLKLSNSFE